MPSQKKTSKSKSKGSRQTAKKEKKALELQRFFRHPHTGSGVNWISRLRLGHLLRQNSDDMLAQLKKYRSFGYVNFPHLPIISMKYWDHRGSIISEQQKGVSGENISGYFQLERVYKVANLPHLTPCLTPGFIHLRIFKQAKVHLHLWDFLVKPSNLKVVHKNTGSPQYFSVTQISSQSQVTVQIGDKQQTITLPHSKYQLVATMPYWSKDDFQPVRIIRMPKSGKDIPVVFPGILSGISLLCRVVLSPKIPNKEALFFALDQDSTLSQYRNNHGKNVRLYRTLIDKHLARLKKYTSECLKQQITLDGLLSMIRRRRSPLNAIFGSEHLRQLRGRVSHRGTFSHTENLVDLELQQPPYIKYRFSKLHDPLAPPKEEYRQQLLLFLESDEIGRYQGKWFNRFSEDVFNLEYSQLVPIAASGFSFSKQGLQWNVTGSSSIVPEEVKQKIANIPNRPPSGWAEEDKIISRDVTDTTYGILSVAMQQTYYSLNPSSFKSFFHTKELASQGFQVWSQSPAGRFPYAVKNPTSLLSQNSDLYRIGQQVPYGVVVGWNTCLPLARFKTMGNMIDQAMVSNFYELGYFTQFRNDDQPRKERPKQYGRIPSMELLRSSS